MVELMITLPLLVAFCLMAVDLGRGAYVVNALSNAARVGAEQGATRQFTAYTMPSWTEQVEQAVADEMASLTNFSADLLAVEIETIDLDDDHRCIAVTVEYEFETVIPWPGIARPMSIRRQVAMRQYR